MGACEEVGSAEQVGGRGGRGEAKGLNFKKILKKKKKKKKKPEMQQNPWRGNT